MKKATLYEKVLKNAPFGYAYHQVVLDTQGKPVDYIFLEVNATFEALTGLVAKDIIGKRVTEVLPDIIRQDFSWIQTFGEIAMQGTTTEFDQFSLPLQRWYRVQVFAPEVNYFVTTFVDITENKQQQKTIVEREHYYQQILDSIQDNIFCKDKNLRLKYVNRATCNYYNATPEQLYGIIDVHHNDQDFTELYNSYDTQVFTTGKAVEIPEEPNRNPDGEVRYFHTVKTPIFDSEGNVVEVVGVARDITERKRTQEQLRDSEERLRLSLTAAEQGLFDVDLTTNHAVVNEEYTAMLGYAYEESDRIQALWKDLIHPDDREYVLKTLDSYLKGFIPDYKVEYRMRHADGSWVWILEIGKIVQRAENGSPLRLLGTHINITYRKEVEEALRHAHERLYQLAEHTETVTWEVNTEGLYTYISDIALKVFGYHPSDIIGKKHYYDISPAEGRERFKEETLLLMHQKRPLVSLENKIVHKDGHVLWVETNGLPITDKNGILLGYRGSDKNITARKTIELEQKKNQEQLQQAQQLAHLGYWELTIPTQKLVWSEQVYRIFGMGDTKPDNLYEFSEEHIHPDDREMVRQSFTFAVEQKTRFQLMHRILRQDGSVRYVVERATIQYNDEGKPIVALGIIQDISHLKAIEEALRTSEEKYRFLTEFASDVIWVYNYSQQQFTYMSPAVFNLRGFTPEEALRQTLKESLSEESFSSIRRAMNAKIAEFLTEPDDHEYYITEVQQTCKSGELIWVEVAMRFRYNDKREVEIIGVSRNIEQRKLMEQELRHNEQHLQELNATKDKLFSIIAHDLKNPLGNFKQITQLLADTYMNFSDAERQDVLQMMKDSAHNLYALLENLLDWSRSQRGHIRFRPVFLHLFTVVESICNIMKAQAFNKRIILKNTVDTDFTLAADANLLSTILRNLISNAIKFTPDGGTITISLTSHYGDPVIAVRDTGVGMSPEQINKLFSLNENTSSLGTAKEQGTGLGLILCKEFIEKHGGTITVASEPGKGSTFSFTLPQDIQTYADIEGHSSEE